MKIITDKEIQIPDQKLPLTIDDYMILNKHDEAHRPHLDIMVSDCGCIWRRILESGKLNWNLVVLCDEAKQLLDKK